jgi:SagB-type dehydrogenase family enzyme
MSSAGSYLQLWLAVLPVLAVMATGGLFAVGRAAAAGENVVQLPEPRLGGPVSLEKALQSRRSVRHFKDEPITLAQVSQLLWAAQGITGSGRFRTAPSAGALYPLEIHLVAGKVEGLAAGVYRYVPQGHQLQRTLEGDRRRELSAAALGQSWVRECPAVLVIAAVYERTSAKYLGRGRQYVHIEVGHAAQNVLLQGVALDLGTVMVGAFHDEDVQKAVGLGDGEKPLCLIPVGRNKY